MPDQQRPNIVLIMVDDADRKVLEHQASARIRAALADQGASAARYLLSHPQCAPSRASMLRGRYPQNTGVQGNNGAYGAFLGNGGETSNVAVWLRAAQYRTAMIGKYINGYKVGPKNLHVPPGWDYWFGVGKSAYNGYRYDANENGVYRTYGSAETDYLTDVLALKSLQFVRSSPATDPFFLVVNPMAPHSPSVPAAAYDGMYAGESYPTGANNPAFNEADVTDKPWFVSKIDPLDAEQIGKIQVKHQRRLECMESVADLVEALISALDEVPGRLDNTYVFFTSDNGFHMGEHRLGRDDVQDEAEGKAPGGKNTMYEEDIRVPLWVRGPGIAPGSTVPQLLGNVDLAPTFCAIAGTAPGSAVDGRDFLPLLLGQSVPWRTQYLISRGQNKTYAGIRSDDDWVFAELDEPMPTEVVGELYDLTVDPFELDNRYLSMTDTERAQLQTKVDAYRVCAGASCRVADSA